MTRARIRLVCLALAAPSLGCFADGGELGASASASASASTSTGAGTESASATETAGETTGTTGDPLACWSDLAIGERAYVYEGFPQGSEGIAFGADGMLYATADGIVWRIDGAGQASAFATVPDAIGLAARADGSFVVASFGEWNAADGAIYEVDAAGEATLLAIGIDSPNFVTLAPDGSALVSDDFDTRVFRVDGDGALSVVIGEVASPNGMAYSPDGGAFFVASTFTDDGQLTRYEVDEDGLPVEASALEILHLGGGTTPDGIAIDEEGRVYVAANLAGEIWRVEGAADGLVDGELVAADVAYPASIAFGVGPAFDPCSIYVTELDGPGIVRISLGLRGAPLYH